MILNPRVLNGGGGGKFTPPQTTVSAAIPTPLGISETCFVTFPEYDLATGWRFQTIPETYQKSNMRPEKPEML